MIYNRIFTIFKDNINGEYKKKWNPGLTKELGAHNRTGIPATQKLARYRCFLTMILKLRMFSSHALTIQDMLKSMLTDDMMRRLISLSNEKRDPEHPSRKITKWLVTLRKDATIPKKPGQTQDSQENPSNPANPGIEPPQATEPPHGLQGNVAKLVRQFHALMSELHDSELWGERLSRTSCARCESFPEEAIITSCSHLYCEECYYLAQEQDGQSEGGKTVCCKCHVDIDEAAHCGAIDDFQLNMSAEPTTASGSQAAQRKKKKKPQQKARGSVTKPWMFSRRCPTNSDSRETDDSADDGDDKNWISIAAYDMPGAKLTKVREIIASWIAEDKDVKVVVFTQFVDFIRILGAMCGLQGWGYTLVRLPVLVARIILIFRSVDGKNAALVPRQKHGRLQRKSRNHSVARFSQSRRNRPRHVDGKQMHSGGSVVE